MITESANTANTARFDIRAST